MAFGLNHLLIYQNDATPIFLWDIYGGFGYEILMVIFSSNFQNDVHPDNIKKLSYKIWYRENQSYNFSIKVVP